MALIEIYLWGVAVDFVIHLVSLTFYLFGSSERWTYENNLNKIGISWDPIYIRIYSLEEFKHTWFRFIWMNVINIFGCLLSWFSVLYRIRTVLRLRELRSLMTPENKKAAIILRTNPDLSKEDVEKLFLESEPVLAKMFQDAKTKSLEGPDNNALEPILARME